MAAVCDIPPNRDIEEAFDPARRWRWASTSMRAHVNATAGSILYTRAVGRVSVYGELRIIEARGVCGFTPGADREDFELGASIWRVRPV